MYDALIFVDIKKLYVYFPYIQSCICLVSTNSEALRNVFLICISVSRSVPFSLTQCNPSLTAGRNFVGTCIKKTMCRCAYYCIWKSDSITLLGISSYEI